MPDLADRNAREADLSAKIFAALGSLRASIEAAKAGRGLTDWGAFTSAVQSALSDSLSATFRAAASQLVEIHGEGQTVDDAATNNAADAFAATMAAKLAADVTANTQSIVNTPNTTMDDLSPWLSKPRADTIAITETTRAISQGEDYAAAAIALLLARTVTWTWQTEEDSLVCPICAPLNGKENPGVDQPAHPNCRCTKRYDFSAPLIRTAA